MRSLAQSLQQTFWSLYGRYVWDAQKSPWKTLQLQSIVDALRSRQTRSGERVLDAGCGTGDYAIALAQAGFEVTAIDYAAGMLSRAQAKGSNELAANLSFQKMDLNDQLVFPEAYFDHVINISVLQVTTLPTYTLGELWRVLKPGGTLLLLHVPRAETQNRPLRETIKYRATNYGEGSRWKMILIAAKAWAERSHKACYWTVEELQHMLKSCHFDLLSMDPGPPILIMAQRPKAVDDTIQHSRN